LRDEGNFVPQVFGFNFGQRDSDAVFLVVWEYKTWCVYPTLRRLPDLLEKPYDRRLSTPRGVDLHVQVFQDADIGV